MKLSQQQRMHAYRVLIGEAITAERQRKGMSQQTVADLSGTSRVSISYYENALRAINTEELFSICDACGFDPYAIISKATNATQEELEIAYTKYFQRMSKMR